jgi:cyclopropane fatty-acyl-phospholipid synthase-like methyltransferase
VSKKSDYEKRFRDRYAERTPNAMLAIEREVIGANVGANGYTTLQQADMLAERLQLTPKTTVLDIGSGRGWPGLYLAATRGCRIILSDVPEPGLTTALRQADRQDVSTASVIRATADHLPFMTATFDAITHTDTL